MLTLFRLIPFRGPIPRAARARNALLIAAAAATAAACNGDAGARGGTVVVGVRSDFGGFNPITSSAAYDIELNNYALFTPLVQYDDNLGVRPYLAESWEMQDDTAVVFRLRTDVVWHDGQPVTAHDVEFTFNRAKDPASASLLATAFLASVESAHVIDDHTIAFRFSRPHAQALEDFWWAPAPRHLLENVSAAEMRNAPFNRQPVGSGPFLFQQWRANEQLVLVRNPAFPEGLGGPAAADRMVFRVLPEASTQMTELITGTLHVNLPLLPDQVRQIRDDPDLELHSFPGRTVYFIGWNNEREPFVDPNVRRALALAINRREIVDALLYGEGEIATSPIPTWHRLYPGVEPIAHDPQEAARLLDAAGWQDRNGDGIRENTQGRRLAFTMMSSDDALRRSVVEVVQNQLRRIGADVQIQVLEFQTMRQRHIDRDYDAVFTNWVLDNFQVAAAPMSLLHSSQADIAGSANRSSVRIPELDAAMERAAATTDEGAARDAWREFTTILQQRQPVTFMFWLNELAASRSNVYGVVMDPRGELQSVAEWTVSR